MSPDPPDLDVVYRAYVAELNAHRMRDLERFVADRLVYNGSPMTRAEYEALLAGNVRDIPDLHFDVRQVVVAGQDLAARIRFVCTPVVEWRGRQPDGRSVRFDEHVFYRFEEGRIAVVHSVISAPAEIDARPGSEVV